MKRYETPFIRNVTLGGHGGTGKTSLGEAILYTSKATTRLGSVEGSTSVLDYEPEEVKRKTSYASGVASTAWKKHKVNILDTPGASAFAADTRLCMKAGDLFLLLISAVDQVEVGSERAWASASELACPTVVFVNKMGKERADFDKTLSELQSQWGNNIAPLQIPIGSEGDYTGVVDLLHMKAYTYAAGGDGKGSVGEIPADLQDTAAAAREQLIEAIASSDDDLLEKYLETMELSEDEVRSGLKAAIVSRELTPVLCGSATQNIGVDALLDFLTEYGPSPADMPALTAEDVSGELLELTPDSNAPLVALVFKAAYLDMGKVCFLRIFQGKGDPDQNFYNVTQESKERWGQVLAPLGKKLDGLSGVPAGDIVAIPKLKETVAGDVLCADKTEIRIETPSIPAPCISFALKPRKKGDEDKIANAMSRVLDCDPSLRTSRDSQTKDHLLSGMGQTHIEVAVEKMRRYGGDVELSLPAVPYRECIRKSVSNVEGKHKKQSGGRGQFGVCYIDMEPASRGDGLVFENGIYGGSIPSQFIPAVEKGMKESLVAGPLAGYPVVDVKVRLTDGKFHPVDSDGRSFEMAAKRGFKAAFLECSPTLLEPVMNLEVRVPDECLGDVMGDINSRRGRVQGMDSAAGGKQVIRAQVPQAEVLSYSPDLRSLTGGRGSFTIEFSDYQEVPGNLLDSIVAAAQEGEQDHD